MTGLNFLPTITQEQVMTDINKLAQQLEDESLPPVEKWNPDYCGDIDMVIKRDGSWHYMGTPIGRKKLVKLFSNVIRKDDNKYYLVTPVEKIGITVEDAPFLAVLMDVEQQDGTQQLIFTDNVGNRFIAGNDHPIRVEVDPNTQEPSPYIRVRRNLDALISRNVFYQMVELADQQTINDSTELTIKSQGETFSLGRVN